VTLEGFLEAESQRQRATKAALRVKGVESILQPVDGRLSDLFLAGFRLSDKGSISYVRGLKGRAGGKGALKESLSSELPFIIRLGNDLTKGN
jgi:hypothetical protein